LISEDVSTLRRHMAAFHETIYRKWCKENEFKSMLPEDTKARRAAQLESVLRQTEVDDHFAKENPEDKPKPYSDKLFEEAAIQWLIEMDQPVQAFEHPSFKHMIEVAGRATQGVKIPSRKQTQQAIVNTFKNQMKALSERLNVSR
ncbi:hypothetical protein BDZ97DRAFT_1669110, partial [Flammula alnicola]